VKIRFDRFVLDGDTRQLLRDGQEVRLTPKAFDLLVILASDRPNVVSKQVLQQRLWPDTFVAEANLSNLIAELREALADRPPRIIRTSHRFGYAFSADVATDPGRESANGPPTCWLEWAEHRFPLSPGEHVVGRDPDADIRIESSTVSRRHAQVSVTEDAALLEDFGSKNGTFLHNERVTSPVPLANGDAIRFGSVLVTFHVRGEGSTETASSTS